jgi:hypothetical protein
MMLMLLIIVVVAIPVVVGIVVGIAMVLSRQWQVSRIKRRTIAAAVVISGAHGLAVSVFVGVVPVFEECNITAAAACFATSSQQRHVKRGMQRSRYGSSFVLLVTTARRRGTSLTVVGIEHINVFL